MKIKGIEYYDAISFKNETIQTAKSFLKYGVYPVNSGSLYAYDGLYLHEMFIDYSQFNGNALCLNFKLNIIQDGLSYSTYISDPRMYLKNHICFVQNQLYNNYSVQNEKIYSYDDAYNLFYSGYNNSYSGYANYTFSVHETSHSQCVLYNYYGGRSNLVNFLQSGYHIYSLLFKDNTLSYIVDGNIKNTISCPLLKYFIIFGAIRSGHSSAIQDNAGSLQWVTFTDNISLEFPEPPYSLDEKDNELYGYKK